MKSCESQELLSVVTPVYNAIEYLPVLYGCLRAQSYGNWKWIVVNDGSTDGSGKMLKDWAARDDRIIYYETRNSGSAKQPRDMGVYKSPSRLVMCIDADDYVAPDYMQKMLERMADTGADIVYSVMRFIDNEGKCRLELPVSGFDRTKVYVGRELVRETIPDWRISGIGLYDKTVWNNLSYPEKKVPVWMNSDEVDERLCLVAAKTVAFADAVYYYISHGESITKRFSPKLFHRLKTDRVLLDFIKKEFGKESIEYTLINRQMSYTWRSSMALYVRNFHRLYAERDMIYRDLSENFRLTDTACLSVADRIKFLNLWSFRLVFFLFCLKYSPKCLIGRTLLRFFPSFCAWPFFRSMAEKEMAERISTLYNEDNAGKVAVGYVIPVSCGETSHDGLVDRLRGAVSVYMICKETGRSLKIHFVSPFRLTDYIVPNIYDWYVDPGGVSFCRSDTETIILDTATDTSWERRCQKRFLRRRLARSSRQLHVYTNASFCYDGRFGQLFSELFRPSAKLQEHIDEIKSQIGSRYISVSARFLNLLGDSAEEYYSEPLPVDERKALTDECVGKIKELHDRYKGHRILVCSDSIGFQKMAAELEYTSIISGAVSHMGDGAPYTYEYYEKAFLDFFTIAGAERVFLLKESRMANSGFTYAAALSEGKECEMINF